jgi:hypothetical protein
MVATMDVTAMASAGEEIGLGLFYFFSLAVMAGVTVLAAVTELME